MVDRVIKTAQVRPLVPGNGSNTGGLRDGAAASARFSSPSGVAVAGAGKLYVADVDNNRIRAIDLSTNTVTTLAGDGTRASTDNTTGSRAQFGRPKGLALSKDGNTLYVSDQGTHRIRSIALTGTNEVKTIAGNGRLGHKDGNGTAAQFNAPIGLAVSGDTLYVTDFGNNRIRAIDLTTNEVTTIAGDGTTGNTDGIGTNAPIGSPVGIAASGNTLYVTTNGGLIRKIEYREVGS